MVPVFLLWEMAPYGIKNALRGSSWGEGKLCRRSNPPQTEKPACGPLSCFVLMYSLIAVCLLLPVQISSDPQDQTVCQLFKRRV